MSFGSDMYAIDGKTGAVSVVIPEMAGTDQYHYAMFPAVVGNDLYFFHTLYVNNPPDPFLLDLVRSAAADPLNMTILRSGNKAWMKPSGRRMPASFWGWSASPGRNIRIREN